MWLRSLGLEQYEAAFRENGVDEVVLPKLTAEDVKDLGVTAVGHRRKLLEGIAELKTATIPAEQAPKEELPPLLQGFGAVPPLVTDIDLSMDDRFLYVSCWGTGEMRQYDVTDPRKPKLAGSVHIGGIARRTAHPSGKPYAGGPQMVEISRDGRRVYWTNSLYSTWDNQFYPDGIPGAEVMANASANGGLELAKDYWVSFPDGYRAHQIRLDGGDCSTDSFCYPSA